MDLDRQQKLSQKLQDRHHVDLNNHLLGQIKNILQPDKYSVETNETKTQLLSHIDQWPKQKWEDKLYAQYPLDRSSDISEILKRYLADSTSEYSFVWFLNSPYTLIKIDNYQLVQSWEGLIQADNDSIYIKRPADTSFICIEKTEDTIVGHEELGRLWIYEITFSAQELKRYS